MSQDEGYPKYERRRVSSLRELREAMAAAMFNADPVVYSAVKADLTAEALDRVAQECANQVTARRESFATEIREAARAYASQPGAFGIADVEHIQVTQHYAIDHAHSGPNDINVLKAEPLERPLANFNVFDAVKLAARQARISRNETRVYPVIKQAVMAKTVREHDLCRAIERTQLPHETTIHERIMPYRVKGE